MRTKVLHNDKRKGEFIMGIVNISSINNEALKKAAQAADTQGDQSYNNELDASELSVFIKEAAKNGCNKDEMMQIVNDVGVAEDDAETNKTITQYNELAQLRSTLASKTAELQTRQDQLEQMEQKVDDIRPQSTTTGERIGSLIGGLGAFVGMMKFTGGGVKGALISILGAVLGAGLGGVSGMGINALVNRFSPLPHEGKVEEKNIERYQETAIIPLENEIKELEEQIDAKEKEFFA